MMNFVSDSLGSFVLSLNEYYTRLDDDPDVSIKILRTGYVGLGTPKLRLMRPKVIVFANSELKAQEIKNEVVSLAAKYKKKLKFHMDMIGSADVLLSERDAKSSIFQKGSTIKKAALDILRNNSLTPEICAEIRKIEALKLKEEPIYTITKNTGTNYTYTYYSFTQNKRVQRSVGDIAVLYCATMTNGLPAYKELHFHENTRKIRTDRFIPSPDNCVYYSDILYIRERIERNGASSAPAAPIQSGAVPTVKLPTCPACGGKITIRTSKDGKLKLECINYFEKGRTCPNNYNIENYIKITY